MFPSLHVRNTSREGFYARNKRQIPGGKSKAPQEPTLTARDAPSTAVRNRNYLVAKLLKTYRIFNRKQQI